MAVFPPADGSAASHTTFFVAANDPKVLSVMISTIQALQPEAEVLPLPEISSSESKAGLLEEEARPYWIVFCYLAPTSTGAAHPSTGGLEATVVLQAPDGTTRQERLVDEDITDPRYTEEDRLRRRKELVRLGVRRVITEAMGLVPSPWGILVGVRPTKLVHRLLDKGFIPEEIVSDLQKHHGLEEEKARLVTEVSLRQRKFLPDAKTALRRVSIYVGIPFCPTRCAYCSFAAYPLREFGHLVPPYLEALFYEIREVGRWLQGSELEVESLYIGGGTPTVLSGVHLARLFEAVDKYLRPGRRSKRFSGGSGLSTRGSGHSAKDSLVEYTVEAGRPETLTGEKTRLLKEAGVDRVSINPQSMHDTTLERIGRRHSVADIYRAFALAREAGFAVINMDTIVGLPGESLADVEKTFAKIRELAPENLTVHSLAVKRASTLRAELSKEEIMQAKEAEAMVEAGRVAAGEMGMIPYYLYRQRHIFGNLENVGYARPGAESVYNIQMMEERQTIIALGAGGITKLVAPGDWRVERVANPKCPSMYADGIAASTLEKVARLDLHFQ